MTIKDKLLELYPELISEKIQYRCPAEWTEFNHLIFQDEAFCSSSSCAGCWNEEYKGKVSAPSSITSTCIKDSGDRRAFETGAVRDMAEGKGRMDLLPWAAIMEISKHCENGAKKYGEHNVDKGIPTHSLCDSAARHLAKYLDGWDDEPHLLAAAWNLLWAIQMEVKHPELVDTPWKGESK